MPTREETTNLDKCIDLTRSGTSLMYRGNATATAAQAELSALKAENENLRGILAVDSPYHGIEAPDCAEDLRRYEAKCATMPSFDPLHSDYFIGGYQAADAKANALRSRVADLEAVLNRVIADTDSLESYAWTDAARRLLGSERGGEGAKGG